MRLTGHTPLSQTSESSSYQALLSSLWIESAEEFAAMMAAIDAADESSDPPAFETLKTSESSSLSTLRNGQTLLLQALPSDAMTPWQQATPGGTLGCLLDPDTFVAFREHGRLSLPGSVAPQMSDAPLPPSVRLMDDLFPVRDQGQRGTCVAFACVGLREYVDGLTTELSEQFLYWGCKQNDGYPEEPGTFVATAMAVLHTKGVCPRNVWPYNPTPIPGNESQDPPADGAEQAAQDFVMPYNRSVAANSVNHYKQVLSGADDQGGMPIVIASLVFNSWYRSPATRQTGKITMPLPGEPPLSGGHAMLIVGYQDDAAVPGGGYFIVRNSWGEAWAAESPESPGHALMPYAYVEKYIKHAYSGQQMAGASLQNTKRPTANLGNNDDPFEERYVRVLEERTRDVRGAALYPETPVICHPNSPHLVMRDTPENRALFKSQQYAWTDDARQGAWLPPEADWTDEFRQAVQHAYGACQTFADAVDENVALARRKEVPDVTLPFWCYALAWIPKVSHVEKVADLTSEFAQQLCQIGGLPSDVSLSSPWQKTLNGTNRLCVYSLRSFAGQFHVVSAFASPLRFSENGDVASIPPPAEIVEAVQSIYRQWSREHEPPRFTFFTIGAVHEWPPGTVGTAGGQHLSLLSARDDGGSWISSTPPQFATKSYLRNFIDRLYPETREQRVSRIKSAVDEYIDTGYSGNILLDKIAQETGYRRTLVKDAFRAMQDSGHYECYRKDRQIAIRKSTGQRALRLRPDRAAFVRYHLGLATGVSLAIFGWFFLNYLETGIFNWLGLGLIIPFAYAGKCLEIAVQRNQTDI